MSYSGIISVWAGSKSSWSSNCYSWNWSWQRWNSSQEGCPSSFSLSKTEPCLLIEQLVASPSGHRCLQCLLWAPSNFHPANHCKSFESIGLYDHDESFNSTWRRFLFFEMTASCLSCAGWADPSSIIVHAHSIASHWYFSSTGKIMTLALVGH